MAFFNRKKKVEEETNQSTDDELMDFLSEDEEEENEFQPADDIEIEQDATETRGRRLKNNVIIGGIAAAVLLGGFMIFYDKIFPKEKPVQQQEAQVSSQNMMGNVPKTYEDLAKFDAMKEQRAKEEAYLREREAKRKAEEEAALNKKPEVEEKKPVREVQVPQSEAPRVSAPSISAPSFSVPSMSRPIDRGDQQAATSGIGYTVGGEKKEEGIFGLYSTSENSRVDARSSHVVHAGSIIPCTLLTGIDTRMQSMVTAQVRQDVYDSLTGQHLIIPQGAKLLGQLTTTGRARRVAVAFERIILPDGSSIQIPKQVASDNQGYGGMKDKFRSHDAPFFRAALISGLMGYLSDVVDDKMGNKSGMDDNGNSYSSAVKDTTDRITEHIMDRADASQEEANAEIRQGYQFNVLLTQDLQGYEYIRR